MINALKKMKFYKTVSLFVLIMSNSMLIAQNFQWVKALNGDDWNIGKSINLHQNGDIYITGTFQSTMDFDTSLTSAYNLTAIGTGEDTFICKLDSNGNFIWGKSFGGPYIDGPTSSTLDATGAIYTTGYFRATSDLDPSSNEVSYTSYYESDIFINKLDTDGNYVWSKHFGGNGNNIGTSIVNNDNGYVYMAGNFLDTLNFDTDTEYSPLISKGVIDMFFCKIDYSGSIQWVRQIGGAGIDEINSIETDSLGNVYLTGYFNGTVDFDTGVGEFFLTSEYEGNPFVCKYDSNGNFIWVKQFDGGTSGSGRGVSISIDNLGNVYTSGSFSGTLDFDPSPNNYNLTHDQNLELYISKLDNSGNFIWAKHINVNLNMNNATFQLDDNGDVYILGTFYGAYDFDPNNSIYALNSPNSDDIFLCKLDTNGTFISAIKMGSLSYNEQGKDLRIDSSGDIFVTGYYSNQVDFDPSIVNEYYLDGFLDVFILKLSQDNYLNINKVFEKEIQVYPNPISEEKVNLSAKNIINKIEVYNTIGQLQLELSPNTIFAEIDLTSLPPGIYIFRVFIKNSYKSIKIIKS